MPYIYTGRKDSNRFEHTSFVVEGHEIETWRNETLEDAKCQVLFTNGCYDILHPGHIRVFHTMKRRNPNSSLIVGLNSDDSVRRLKGQYRPINNEAIRIYNLMAVAYVDFVFVFNSDTPEDLIKLLKPTILFKGGDYTPDKVAGSKFVKGNGGQVIIIERDPKYSTTDLITKIGHTYIKESFGEDCLILKGER